MKILKHLFTVMIMSGIVTTSLLATTPDDTEILTREKIIARNFWDTSKATGNWKILPGVSSESGSPTWDRHNKIRSRNAYKSFSFQVITQYQLTDNLDKDSSWAWARGFALMYETAKIQNMANYALYHSVEFRYYPDAQLLELNVYPPYYPSLGQHHRKKGIYFPPNTEIVHEIIIHEGLIQWYINGECMFNVESDNLIEGYLQLTNHNNATLFKFP